ncbi:MAG: ATP-binding protein [Burkholderiaceae bacterium]|nr:ATP-binding protein [Burkholderiaceae bacterium]
MVWLAQQKHDFRTVAIDTVDWLETLIHKEVAKQAGKNSIADIGYGNGYKQANAYWAKMIRGLDWLRIEHGMTIILLAHSEIKKHQDPLLDSYDRYQPALHEQASATLQEWCDEVLFASYRVYTRKEDQGFDKKRTIASGASERYLRCVETPAALAKNRLNMPGEIEFNWAAYSQYFAGVSAEVKG